MRELYRETVEYLLYWYDYNRRILPWRENPKPYYVWVSEIMLQQTRVEAVKGYFDRFLTALPTIKDLAEASEETLLKLWEGLGYYNRVRNMQKAAKEVVQNYDWELPADYEALKKLPGIGSYTAGAIASIAFHIPEPAVDGNVLRVMKRVAGSFDDITKASVKKELEDDIRVIMPKDRPGDYNQALMELGAMVCIPNGKPLCETCPLMHLCRAFKEETQAKIPVKPPKKERRIEQRAVMLVQCGDKFILHKRPKKGLLAGLWELPNFLVEANNKYSVKLENKEADVALTQENNLNTEGKACKQKTTGISTTVGSNFEKEYNLSEIPVKNQICNKMEDAFLREGITVQCHSLNKAKHIFSHIEWHMTGYCVTIEETVRQDLPKAVGNVMKQLKLSQEMDTEEYVLVSKEELEEIYPLPSAFETYRKIMI